MTSLCPADAVLKLALLNNNRELEHNERKMTERKKVNSRSSKEKADSPAINHPDNIIASESRHRATRQARDVYVEDLDLPTMFFDVK